METYRENVLETGHIAYPLTALGDYVVGIQEGQTVETIAIYKTDSTATTVVDYI